MSPQAAILRMEYKRIVKAKVQETRERLADARTAIELAIAAQPTSKQRNTMTDANIHIHAALDALKALS